MRINLIFFRKNLILKIFSPVFSMLISTLTVAEPIRLPRYNVDKNQTSVSGLSAGGYMAVQMHVAHSSIMRGVGIFAAGPFHCAEGSLITAIKRCMSPGAPGQHDLQRLVRHTRNLAAKQSIDRLTNLAHQKIWIFEGMADDIVVPAVSDTLPHFYANFMSAADAAENIVYIKNIRTYHNLVVLDGDQRIKDCDYNNKFFRNDPYINDCNYDAAGIMLQHIYGPLSGPRNANPTGKFVEFYQNEFYSKNISMARTGWAYVPENCANMEACKLHISFHGCHQSHEDVNDVFIKNSGLNQWADKNSLIVLYPQVIATFNPYVFDVFHFWGPNNPKACFDWWGYSEILPFFSPSYDTKKGGQIEAIKAMIDRIAQ